MVPLPEDPLPLSGIGDGGVFKSRLTLDGYLKDGPAIGLQHPVELGDRLSVIRYVFEDVAAVNDVERILGE